MSVGHGSGTQRVLVAGATRYLGKSVAPELKRPGYWVRILTRSVERLEQRDPLTAPAIAREEVDELLVGKLTKPETLADLFDGDIDLIFSSVGISRQRDRLSFEQVDYQANRNRSVFALARSARAGARVQPGLFMIPRHESAESFMNDPG